MGKVRSRPNTSPPAPAHGLCRACCNHPESCVEILEAHDAQVAKAAREELQPFVDFVKLAETKNREMADLIRRNGMKIDNLKDPMQKLAFTFYSEIAELSHKAEVILEEYAESLRQPEPQQEAEQSKEER